MTKRSFPLGLGLVFLILVGVLVYNFFGQQPATEKETQPKPPATGKPAEQPELQLAPDFTLTDLDGKSVSLQDYKGQNIYLNFWASWCGPCQAEMPDIQKIHEKYKDQNWVVLAVNVGENSEKVKPFIASNAYTFPILLDPKGSAAKLYKVSSIPVSLFINAEGHIVGKKVGLMTFSQMEAYIAAAQK